MGFFTGFRDGVIMLRCGLGAYFAHSSAWSTGTGGLPYFPAQRHSPRWPAGRNELTHPAVVLSR
jgi:hypothetical protein